MVAAGLIVADESRLTVVIQVRVTEEFAELLADYAERLGLPRERGKSAFLRQAAIEKMHRMDQDQPPRPAKPRTKRRPPSG